MQLDTTAELAAQGSHHRDQVQCGRLLPAFRVFPSCETESL